MTPGSDNWQYYHLPPVKPNGLSMSFPTQYSSWTMPKLKRICKRSKLKLLTRINLAFLKNILKCLFIWGKKNNLNVLFIKAPGTAIRKRVSWNCAFRNVPYAENQQTPVWNTAQGRENSREAELLGPLLPLPLSGAASSGKRPNYPRPPSPYLQNKGNELAYGQEVFWL